MFGLRWALISIEAPLLSIMGHGLTWQEVLFSTAGGLRGGLALILAQTVIAGHHSVTDPQLKVWLGVFRRRVCTIELPLIDSAASLVTVRQGG